MKKKLSIGAVVVLILVAGAVALSRSSGPATPKSAPGTEKVPEITIAAKGSVVPVKQAKLAFKTAARVDSVAVRAGDRVTKGQTLASLETADLALQVRAAEDALAVNEALLSQARIGARPEEIEAAEAGYDGALARYSQTVAGATDAEIKAAAAALEAAKERLAQVETGSESEDLTAQSALESARAKLAQLKSSPTPEDVKSGELEVEKAKASLWGAQGNRDGVCGRDKDDYPCTQANSGVMAAETAVLIAQTSLAKVKAGPSREDLAAAEAAVQQSQAQLDFKRATSGVTVSSALAAVESAQAKLDQLKAGPTDADVQNARSGVATARASVETKKKGPAEADIEVARARVQQTRTAVEQARLALAAASLRAPFDGTVVAVNVRAGEISAPGDAAITLGDLSRFQVETTDLDEASATKVQVGQAVRVIVNAFDDKVLLGKVASIAPVATLTQSGDANYVAVVDFATHDESLRWGMTTKVDFGAAR